MVKGINMIKEFRNKFPKVDKTAYVASSAELIGDVEVGENSSIWSGAVLRGDMHYIRIGKNSSVQDNSVMHGTADNYPTIVGDNVTIGHGAIVHGCKIGNNCLIGMGAIILEGAEIGDWCIIGAGSVVTEGSKIPDENIVLGIPGKVAGKVTEEHKKRIEKNWKAYSALKNEYMKI
ncbi:gamma carbonic anhydrase family protein [Candidatus Marsarchaeota archaeon]|jgi:carbonic anhydrase/acetyltransferase-like protein (isoleucine patch superfamily)|nr:gamma carbonic anhydrase family protein [Candidatus Marsarchaeota archaeon]